MIDPGIQISVCQFLAYFLSNAFTVDQPLNLIPCYPVCLIDKLSDDAIAAGIHPVILGCHKTVHFQSMTVAHHIPRAVYLQFPEAVAVIPFLYGIVFLHKSIILQHLPYFLIRKPEVFLILHILYRIYIKIIKTSKDALPGNPKTPGKHCKIKAAVGFKRLTKKGPDIIYHSVIVA